MIFGNFAFFFLTFKYLIDHAEISYLSVALAISSFGKIIFQALNEILYPYILKQRTLKEYNALSKKALSFYLASGTILWSFLYISGSSLLRLFTGADHMIIETLLQFLIIAELFHGASFLFESSMQFMGHIKAKSFLLVLSTSLSLTILPQFVTKQGILGAAIVYMIFSILRFLFACCGALRFKQSYFHPQN